VNKECKSALYNSGGFVVYRFSLLEAAFLMWCKIVVNTNWIP